MRNYTLNPGKSFFRSTGKAPVEAASLPLGKPHAQPKRQDAASTPPRTAPYQRNAGRLGGPLSNTQKAELCIRARDAWEALRRQRPELVEGLDDFRHAQVMHAVGKPGLTACTQDDFLPVRARFLELNGQSGAALNAHLAHGTEPKRVAMHKLNEALARAGLPLAYAAAIAKRQHKVTLDDLTVKQIWNLTFTINNRGTAKRRKTA